MNYESSPNDIAIIGMSCRFPGADNVEQFWKNLCAGKESISFFSEDELKDTVSKEELDAPDYIKANGALSGIEMFDASFFGYTPSEAELLPPQFRLFLECVWEAIENSGYSPESTNALIGLYAGSGMNSYLLTNVFPNKTVVQNAGELQLRIFSDKDFLPLHASYKLNLKGPSMNVQTACSTSLVAIHMACQSLLNGECDMALAGGASIDSVQKMGYYYKEGLISSSDGHCRAFDAKASGSVNGNGVGVVFMKRYDEAVRDKDTIYAVIKGSAVNNDGNVKMGFTAPGIAGQSAVIAEAMAMAGVDATMVSYIETHGTGTILGDPIEMSALTQAFKESADSWKCAIGSVKPNIGHTDTAAGVASLIKTALALKYKMIPPSLNYTAPNPQIDFNNGSFYVNTKLTPWNTSSARIAGVSSFGIGGTNAHIILSEVPAAVHSVKEEQELFLLSARSEEALDQQQKNLLQYVTEHPEVNTGDIAYTLKTGKKVFSARRAFVAKGNGELKEILESINNPAVFDSVEEEKNKQVVFMFPGGGAQYLKMGYELYQAEPVFRTHVDECAEILKQHIAADLRDVMFGNEEQSEFRKLKFALPALFTVEYALAELLMSWGITPSAMIGHSLGEYVAATISGVFTLSDALKIVATRGKLFDTLPAGAMLSVFMKENQLKEFVTEGISIAASNGPEMHVLSALQGEILKTEAKLSEQGIEFKRLHIDVAAHSTVVDGILVEFEKCMRSIKFKAPSIPFASNLTGKMITAAEAIDPAYWVRHLRSTVRFSDGIDTLSRHAANAVFLEVGPGRALSTLFLAHPSKGEMQTAVNTIPNVQDDIREKKYLLNSLGKLWLAGVKINWNTFYLDTEKRKVTLPSYPFQRKRYWVDPPSAEETFRLSAGANNKRLHPSGQYYIPSWKRAAHNGFDKNNENANRYVGAVLVFEDSTGFSDLMIKELHKKGANVIRVKAAEEFSVTDATSYTINLKKEEDYVSLVDELLKQKTLPSRILHMFGVTKNNSLLIKDKIDVHSVYDHQYQGFHSLLFLSKAIGKSGYSQPLRMICATNDMQFVTGSEELCVEKATALGALMVIPREFTNIECVSADFSFKNKKEMTTSVDTLLNLVLEVALPDSFSAYRGGYKWLPVFEPVALAKDSQPLHTKIKEGGVYVIPGGLGEVGLIIAPAMAKAAKNIKLVLIGRSGFPGKALWAELAASSKQDEQTSKIRKLLAIEAETGTEIEVMQADVSDEESLVNVKNALLEKYGKINGVIHATGFQAGGGMILLKEKEMVERGFTSKVKGSMVLSNAFNDVNLDFFILFSSINAVLSNFGQVEYCAVSQFQSSFAHYRTYMMGKPTTVINWDRWIGIGSSVEIEEKHRALTGTELEEGITGEEGAVAFLNVLVSDLPQVIISSYDLAFKVERNSKTEVNITEGETADKKTKARHSRPAIATKYVAPQTETELQLAGIWQEISGIDTIGMLDNLFEIGGHSLMAAQIISHVRKKMNAEISLADFFKNPTIANLTEIINAKSGGEKPVASMKIKKVERNMVDLEFSDNGEIDEQAPGNNTKVI